MRFNPWTSEGKRFAIGGSGDGKDKMLIIGLVAIIVVAVAIAGWSLLSGDDEDAGFKRDELGFHCAACENEWVLTTKEFENFQASIAPEDWGNHVGPMGTIIPECPSCGHSQSAQPMTWCPACEKWFYSQPDYMDPLGGGAAECTHCGTNIMQWRRDNAKK